MWILFFIGVGVMVVVLVSVMAYVAINQPEEEWYRWPAIKGMIPMI